MNTGILFGKENIGKIDFQKVLLRIMMTAMEGFGMVALVCGILGIKFF